MPKKIRSEYHYAIKALQNRKRKIDNNPRKYKDAAEAVLSIQRALDLLNINDFKDRAIHKVGEV